MKSKSLPQYFLLLLSLAVFMPANTAAQSATFTNPIVRSRPDAADPWVVYKDGYYYFTFTLGDRIEVWKSATLTGIDRGTKVTVWRAPRTGAQCCNIWAPELHFIGDRWYIYYAADDGRDENHRMYVLESVTRDPQGAYIERGKIAALTDRWAIDGSVLHESDGSLYFIWSGWADLRQGPQNIYIARMSNPWTISGERVLISQPSNAWERIGWWVNEGPQALIRYNKIFIVYSASGGSTPDYCLGMLTHTNGDVLDANAWAKSPGCVFGRTDAVFGPGHNSFVKSPDGTEDWIVYHAKDTPTHTWEGRTPRAQRFTWSADGTPQFGSPVNVWTTLAAPSGEEVAIQSASPQTAPVLVTAEDSSAAVALDSVTLRHAPLPVLTTYNFSSDRHTRLTLFAANVGEGDASMQARAEDASRNIYDLPIEFVGRPAGAEGLTQIIVKVPAELDGSAGVWISLGLRGAFSNKAFVSFKPAAHVAP